MGQATTIDKSLAIDDVAAWSGLDSAVVGHDNTLALELAAANRALLIDRAVADSQFLQSLVAVQRDFQVAEALEEPDAQSQRDVALANAEYDYAVLEAMAQADWKLAAVPAISWAIVSRAAAAKVRWTICPITESPMGRPWRASCLRCWMPTVPPQWTTRLAPHGVSGCLQRVHGCCPLDLLGNGIRRGCHGAGRLRAGHGHAVGPV